MGLLVGSNAQPPCAIRVHVTEQKNMYRELAVYNTGLKNGFGKQWHFKNIIYYRYYSTLLSMPEANCWFATLRSERFTDES
jgi:hypothetical protein